MQLVGRLERGDPPGRTEICEAAARAVVLLLADPRSQPGGEWAPSVLRWTSGRIRKHFRRARGAQWEAAVALPGVTATVGAAQVRAFIPFPVDNIPKEISKLQLSGTEPEDPGRRSSVDPRTGGPLVVSICPVPELPLGKAAAAAAHAAQVAALLMPAERLQAWSSAGYPVVVEHPGRERWHRIRVDSQVDIEDAGFTVVEPGTTTALARWA